MRSHGKLKHCLFTTTMLMATKRGRMMTYLERLLPIKSNGHINTWSCNITWQTKIIIYSLTQCLWQSILAGWGYTIRSFHSWSHQIFWSRDCARSRKLLLLYCLWSLNLAKWWLTVRKFNLLSHTIRSACGDMRSRHKLKIFYLHYDNTCGYQTWQ